MKTRLGKLVIAASVVAFGQACSSSDQASLRVLHASPDAPAVDVLVNDTVALEDVAYLDASGYLETNSGSANVKVNAAGTSTSVIDADVTLEKDTYYTVIAVGLLADIEPLVLEDDRTDPAAGNARVRVVHGAPSAPEVDVYVTAPSPTLASEEPVLEDVPFKGASDFLEVPAGSYEVNVTLAGTKTLAIGPIALTLADGDVRTVVAVEAEGGGAPFSVKVLEDKN